jgi:hypothetical protein
MALSFSSRRINNAIELNPLLWKYFPIAFLVPMNELNAFQARFLTASLSFKRKIGNSIIIAASLLCRVVPYNTGFIVGLAGPAKPYLLADGIL